MYRTEDFLKLLRYSGLALVAATLLTSACATISSGPEPAPSSLPSWTGPDAWNKPVTRGMSASPMAYHGSYLKILRTEVLPASPDEPAGTQDRDILFVIGAEDGTELFSVVKKYGADAVPREVR